MQTQRESPGVRACTTTGPKQPQKRRVGRAQRAAWMRKEKASPQVLDGASTVISPTIISNNTLFSKQHLNFTLCLSLSLYIYIYIYVMYIYIYIEREREGERDFKQTKDFFFWNDSWWYYIQIPIRRLLEAARHAELAWHRKLQKASRTQGEPLV